MYRIGIDVGSTYTKYCVLDEEDSIIRLYTEKTPLHQKEYFYEKQKKLMQEFDDYRVLSCGYGKKNVDGIRNINELIALANGAFRKIGKCSVVLDIGGQDTKIIRQEEGKLKEFFINDKCAAGSGIFLTNVLEMLNRTFGDIDLSTISVVPRNLSSTCAVFAQSEIVEMIADNYSENEILSAVLWQIIIKAKGLLRKLETECVYISGGLSSIRGIDLFVSRAFGIDCKIVENGQYLAAIGCAYLAD